MKTLIMHAGAFGFYLFALAVYNVAYTILLFIYKDHPITATLIYEIGYMIYVTTFFIS